MEIFIAKNIEKGDKFFECVWPFRDVGYWVECLGHGILPSGSCTCKYW